MSGFPVPAQYCGAAALVLTLSLSAPAARAEGLFSAFFDPSPERVVIQLERSGYQIRSALLRRGDVYVCDVVDARGRPQRLVVDARDGRILERFVARPSAYPGPRAYALRDDPPPDYPPGTLRPLVDVPLTPQRGFPLDSSPAPLPELHATNRSGPTIEAPTLPDGSADKPKPKPKPHMARPKPTPSPTPTSEANAAPGATQPAAPQPLATTPAIPTPSPSAAPAAAAPTSPATAAPAPVAEAQPPAAAPAPVKPAEVKPAEAKPGKKPINDLPVDPLN